MGNAVNLGLFAPLLRRPLSRGAARDPSLPYIQIIE